MEEVKKKEPLEMNCIIMSFIAYFIMEVLHNTPLIHGKYFNNKCPRAINCFYLIMSRSLLTLSNCKIDVLNEDMSLTSYFNSALMLMLLGI